MKGGSGCPKRWPDPGLERAKGIEPSYAAWEAAVLPLNYARRHCQPTTFRRTVQISDRQPPRTRICAELNSRLSRPDPLLERLVANRREIRRSFDSMAKNFL